jgi:hypothetical protein
VGVGACGPLGDVVMAVVGSDVGGAAEGPVAGVDIVDCVEAVDVGIAHAATCCLTVHPSGVVGDVHVGQVSVDYVVFGEKHAQYIAARELRSSLYRLVKYYIAV